MKTSTAKMIEKNLDAAWDYYAAQGDQKALAVLRECFELLGVMDDEAPVYMNKLTEAQVDLIANTLDPEQMDVIAEGRTWVILRNPASAATLADTMDDDCFVEDRVTMAMQRQMDYTLAQEDFIRKQVKRSNAKLVAKLRKAS